MGILYSHIVFQPPSPPTYADDNGSMTFRKARPQEHPSDSEDDDTLYTDRSNAGSAEEQHHVQHPIFYLHTDRGNTIPVAYFHQPDSYYTILFSHGNGEDLGVTASYALELSNALKTSVLCYDYSGYGLATGKPSEANCYADIRAAYTFLVSEKRIPPKRIVLFGRSLGSGPTVDLATVLDLQLGGVVLIAALSSCVRVVFNNAPHAMKFDMFPNLDKIDRIRVPIFCVHGMADDVVPFAHGLDLSRRARYPLEPLWIRGAGHNNLESSRFQYEVFLRYMKVLQELRRWKAPSEEKVVNDVTVRRRESFAAFGKVAGCFGPQRMRAHEDEVKRRTGTAKGPSPRRRAPRAQSGSSSQLMVQRPLVSDHEFELRRMWSRDEDGQSLITRRSSGATFGSRSLFEEGDAKSLERSASKASVSSVQQMTAFL